VLAPAGLSSNETLTASGPAVVAVSATVPARFNGCNGDHSSTWRMKNTASKISQKALFCLSAAT